MPFFSQFFMIAIGCVELQVEMNEWHNLWHWSMQIFIELKMGSHWVASSSFYLNLNNFKKVQSAHYLCNKQLAWSFLFKQAAYCWSMFGILNWNFSGLKGLFNGCVWHFAGMLKSSLISVRDPTETRKLGNVAYKINCTF